MRICFLAPASSLHTMKWCSYFTGKGHDVHVVTLVNGHIDGVTIHRLNTQTTADGSDWRKLGYLACYRELQKIIERINPDVINVHYATSYGMLAALSCSRPYILSVWGSDVYDFPNKSVLHKAMLRYSFKRASKLMSTSRAMANEAAKYTDKPFDVTPFGVDTSLFSPIDHSNNDAFVVAIVKALSAIYGIDVLLKAAAATIEVRPDIPLKVRIAGDGPDRQKLKQLSSDLGIEKHVEWLGFISQAEAARVWADADIGVVPSYSESFGVAAVEAQACGRPVIVSDAPGLLEVTAEGRNGLVFSRGDYVELAACIVELYENQALRHRLGDNGRQFVVDHYSYEECFERIEHLLSGFAANDGGRYA